MTSAYDELIELTTQANILNKISYLLEWDQSVMMAPGGAPRRAQQLGVLATESHKLASNPHIGELLSELKGETLSVEQQATVREVAREYKKIVNIPPALVKKVAEQQSRSSAIWEQAKQTGDWDLFAESFKESLDLIHQVAHAIDPNEDPYQVLLDEYAPYAKVSDYEELLAQAKTGLAPLLKKILAQPTINNDFMFRTVPKETQMAFCKEVAETIGFDFENGRADESTHPFSTSTGDVRITVRFIDSLIEPVLASAHEAGHGIYSQSLCEKPYGHPLWDDRGLTVHESQSRIFENHIVRSTLFLKKLYPRMIEAYAPVLDDVDEQDFIKAFHKVEAGMIRVTADELTYGSHVILRFEIERALMNKEISVANIPRVWNEKMQSMLGVTPKNNAEGCLQDVHWSYMMIGYFSTYLVGSMMSAQLWAAIGRDIPNRDELVAAHDIAPILAWLKEKVHLKGKLLTPDQIIEQATGKPLSADDYIAYLTEKYSAIYDL